MLIKCYHIHIDIVMKMDPIKLMVCVVEIFRRKRSNGRSTPQARVRKWGVCE